jgi:hypothetical protein
MFAPPTSRLAHTLFISLLSSLLVSCVSLEFDRMTGTTFPPQHMVNGQPVTLETIYSDAGIKLNVEEDDTTIQPLNIAEDDCISDAELATLENRHRYLSLFPTAACPFSSATPITSRRGRGSLRRGSGRVRAGIHFGKDVAGVDAACRTAGCRPS